MKYFYVFVLFCSPFILKSQCNINVDFNTWRRAGAPSNGNWAVQGGGSQVYQSVNGSDTYFINPFDLINVEVTGEFRTTDNDDDWMGFVFGFNDPLGTNYNTYDMLLFDWKQQNQGCSERGMCLAKVTGTLTGAEINNGFECHINSPTFTILADNLGTGPGWVRNQWHQFRLIYTFSRIIIYVDNVLRFDVTGCFKPGRFGFYNRSQERCTYRNFNYSLDVDFAISSTAFCPNVPVDFTFVDHTCVSNFDFNTVQSMVWDFGDGNQFVNNNPDFSNVNPTHTYAAPGTYQVTLTFTDAQGCVDSETKTVTINPPPAPAFTVSNGCYGAPVNITNNTTAGGSASISSALWDMGDGNTLNTMNPGNYTYSSVGNYTVTLQVTNSNNCSASLSNSVTITGDLTSTVSATPANCPALNDGTASVTNIANGTAPYTYNWSSGGAQGQTIQNLIPGTYLVTITDALGCTGTNSTQVALDNSTPLAYTVTLSDFNGYNVSCNNENDGTATIQMNNGTAPYVYTWNNAQNGAIAQNLSAGSYTVSVTDANTCSATASAVLNQPTPLNVNSTVNHGCFNQNTGSISLAVSGGVPGYSYSWNPATVTGSNPTGLSAGVYHYTVTDNNNCSINGTITLTPPPPINVSTITQNIDCYSNSTGSIQLTATGGYPTYSYTWNPAMAVGQSPSGLIAGTYSYTITDNNNCTANGSVTLSEPPLLIVDVASQDINCYGQNTGSISLTASGGTPNYTYSWSPATVSGSSPIGLTSGTYSYTITDNNNCTENGSVTLNQPPQLVINAASQNIDCYNNSTGSISLAASGGVPGYSYTWSELSTTDSALTGLAAGTYHYTATDNQNCTANGSVTLTQPALLTANATHTNVTCHDGSNGTITINTTGGTMPYSYELEINGVYTAGGQQFQNLAEGTYNARITDAHGCQTTTAATLTQPEAIQVFADNDSAKCYGESSGTIRMQTVGGTSPYLYSSSGIVNNDGMFGNLPAGEHIISITDANGCESTHTTVIYQPDSIIIFIEPMDSIVLLLSETETVTLSANYSDATFNWSPAIGIACDDCPQNTINTNDDIIYTITASTNPHGVVCTNSVRLPITVIPDYRLYIPNAFSPNGDGVNDEYEIFGNKKAMKFIEFRVFNRWGEKVFESNDINFKWDGRYKDNYLPPAVYVYSLAIIFMDNHAETENRGTITILR